MKRRIGKKNPIRIRHNQIGSNKRRSSKGKIRRLVVIRPLTSYYFSGVLFFLKRPSKSLVFKGYRLFGGKDGDELSKGRRPKYCCRFEVYLKNPKRWKSGLLGH